MVLSEAIFITSMAGYIGLLCGIGILYLIGGIESDFFLHPRINIWIGLLAVIILIVAGGLAGLGPSRQAARVNPIGAPLSKNGVAHDTGSLREAPWQKRLI